jgi:uncharacterized coiled-coil protein SlyX
MPSLKRLFVAAALVLVPVVYALPQQPAPPTTEDLQSRIKTEQFIISDLNKTVAEQKQQIDALTQQLNSAKERLAALKDLTLNTATVVYEPGSQEIDLGFSVKLKTLLGASPAFELPTVNLPNQGKLFPRFFFIGSVKPYVFGRQTGMPSFTYYYAGGQWRGPFAPEDISTLQK